MISLSQGLVSFFDYLVLARSKLLDWVRHAPPSVYTQTFPVGLGSIRATLLHVAGSEWGYVEGLKKGEVIARELRENNPFTAKRLSELEPFVEAWDRQESVTRQALADLGDPSRSTDMLVRDLAPPIRLRLTAGGLAGQILFHEIHHRAQVMAMLHQTGIAAQNLDYTMLMVERIALT